jgi:sulfhydrogenase subunit alpha
MVKSLDFELKDIARVDGHVGVRVVVRNGGVRECKLLTYEDKRFFSDALVGMKWDEIPKLMSRVSGVNSSSYVLASIEAIEKAFGVKVSRQSRRLRNLLVNANYLQSHALHLWFYVLPNLLGVDSVLDFKEKDRKFLQDGFDVRSAGSYLSKIIGGGEVYPSDCVVGGFARFATKKDVAEAIKRLKACRSKVLRMVRLLSEKRRGNVFNRKVNFVGLVSDDYGLLEGKINISKDSVIEELDFGRHLSRVVVPNSTATVFELDGKDFFTGALARLNLNKDFLNVNTKRSVSKYLKMFPSINVFDNSLAQAIECLNVIDNSINMLGVFIRKERVVDVVPKEGVGVGVLESPRGLLYCRFDFDKKGVVKFADLCTPSQQNVIGLEKTLGKYIESLLTKGKGKTEIIHEVKRVIRAYDLSLFEAAH